MVRANNSIQLFSAFKIIYIVSMLNTQFIFLAEGLERVTHNRCVTDVLCQPGGGLNLILILLPDPVYTVSRISSVTSTPPPPTHPRTAIVNIAVYSSFKWRKLANFGLKWAGPLPADDTGQWRCRRKFWGGCTLQSPISPSTLPSVKKQYA